MATLAESFLADLDDLSDGDEAAEEPQRADEGDEEDDMELNEDIEALNYDDLSAVAQLAKSDRYNRIMTIVREALKKAETGEVLDLGRATGSVEDDPEHKLLVECNQLAVDIDNEVVVVHNFIRDKYRLKFPELESLVHHPIDYARVVKAIGNASDITEVNLDGILPSATIMVVSVTASTTSGKELSESDLAKTLEACELALTMDRDKQEIAKFVESRMGSAAPNMCAAIGSEVAAKLMGVAGGLINLSKMPACNIQVLGAKRKNLEGFSTAAAQPHQGFIYNAEIIQRTPPPLRPRACRLVGGKVALLARMDAYGQDPSGSGGQRLREEMEKKIEKWQEPPPAKIEKPLPVPDQEPKKKRGGRRLRKMKERYGMTDVRKLQNRINFNQPEEEFLDGDEVVGLGVLGKEGTGRLRVNATNKQQLSARAQKKFKLKAYGSGGGTSGLSSSLAFTPVQGIELENPNKQEDAERSGTESYFSEFSGFSKVIPGMSSTRRT
mmetsp:Transcript_20589/g.49016  ORF Transcript_20589/g.49016 Transcript_20589/m.49016 type:complete len:497 (-) Transcript_20589:41-1531(-)